MHQGVFLLAVTVIGARIGYVIGKTFEKSLGGQAKAAKLSARIGTLYGAAIGVAVAGTYLYMEFIARVFVGGGEAIMSHPIVASIVLLGVAMFVVLRGKGNSDKLPSRVIRV